MEYRHNVLENGSGATVGYDVASAGLMWNWTMREDLESTLAGRWDQLWLNGSGYAAPQRPGADRLYERDFGTFAWNAGMVWRPTPSDALRVTAARGIGSPSLVDLGINLVSTGIRVYGNPQLNPTVVDNYELGWRRQVAAIDGRVGLTVFHEINRALGSSIAALARPASDGGFVVSPVSLGDLTMNGLEVSAAGKLTRGFDWEADYRLVSVEGDLSAGATIDYGRSSPRHLLSSRLGWGRGPFQFDGFLRYASTTGGWRADSLGRPTYVTVDDYASAGARLAYRMENGLTLAAEGSNLLSGRQVQTIGFEAERQLFLSVRMDF